MPADTDYRLMRRSLEKQKLMKRIQRGPVRGISLKLQEEERERRMDFIPEVSFVDVPEIEIDPDTKDMLRALDMPKLPNTVVRDNPGPAMRPQKRY
eukprot:SAG31_NODE_4919_length_2868_cov_1.265800_4_plen_96_part_00